MSVPQGKRRQPGRYRPTERQDACSGIPKLEYTLNGRVWPQQAVAAIRKDALRAVARDPVTRPKIGYRSRQPRPTSAARRGRHRRFSSAADGAAPTVVTDGFTPVMTWCFGSVIATTSTPAPVVESPPGRYARPCLTGFSLRPFGPIPGRPAVGFWMRLGWLRLAGGSASGPAFTRNAFRAARPRSSPQPNAPVLLRARNGGAQAWPDQGGGHRATICVSVTRSGCYNGIAQWDALRAGQAFHDTPLDTLYGTALARG